MVDTGVPEIDLLRGLLKLTCILLEGEVETHKRTKKKENGHNWFSRDMMC